MTYDFSGLHRTAPEDTISICGCTSGSGQVQDRKLVELTGVIGVKTLRFELSVRSACSDSVHDGHGPGDQRVNRREELADLYGL
jgi:hypothetical protein